MRGSDLIKIFGSATSSGGGSMNGIVLEDDFVSGVKIAEWTLAYDGFVYHRKTTGVAVKSDPWINPQTGMNLYEVQATVSSGDTPDGDIGVWVSLGTLSRTWGFQTEYDSFSCVLQIQIRRASDGVILKTVSVTLQVLGLA